MSSIEKNMSTPNNDSRKDSRESKSKKKQRKEKRKASQRKKDKLSMFENKIKQHE